MDLIKRWVQESKLKSTSDIKPNKKSRVSNNKERPYEQTNTKS